MVRQIHPYEKLEKAWSRFNKKKYGVSTNTGTAALHLALASIGIGKGDEVIVPDFCMAAAAFAVSYTGATPVFAPCDGSLNMDYTLIESRITKNTKAILPVHVYGRLCNMEEINKIAHKHKLWVIEDACEVHGAKVGSAHITCFSFYKNKIVSAEEGGMCLTDIRFVAEKMNKLKNMAMGPVRDYNHTEIGFNYRMSDAQALLALKSFKQLKINLEKRQKIKEWYDSFLNIETPNLDVVWVYPVFSVYKDKVLELVKDARPFFRPMSTLKPYGGKRPNLDQEMLIKYGLYLPVNPVMTKKDVYNICKKIEGLV